jgi:hypothetical protein
MCSYVRIDGFTSGLLLSFDKDAHIDRKCAIGSHEGFQGLKYEHSLAFVIDGPTRIEIVSTNCGLEWWRLPKVYRVNWLHVIVAIDENSRLSRSLEPFAINERMALRRDDFDVLEADMSQLIGGILCCPPDITCMFW